MFHATGNVYFKRLQNGDVEITHRPGGPDSPHVAWRYVVPSSIWCSVVASVSLKGEDGGRWNEAVAFHAGA